MTPDPRAARLGAFAALAAFTLWGAFSLYFKALAHVPAFEVLSHRILGGAVFAGLAVTFGRQWGETRAVLADFRRLRPLFGSAVFVAINWVVYIWAVGHGHALEASMGYFIFPLVSVLLGALVLGERLGRRQVAAVAIVAIGVAWLILQGTGAPWIALVLAVSFGLYGLLRKTTPVQSVTGLFLECLLLALPAAVYLIVQGGGQTPVIDDARTWTLIALAGPVTAVPLILFAYGARRLRLSTLGLMMYVNPTLQFLIAVFAFGEAFTTDHAVAFAAIWAGLAVYSVDPRRLRRKTKQPG